MYFIIKVIKYKACTNPITCRTPRRRVHRDPAGDPADDPPCRGRPLGGRGEELNLSIPQSLSLSPHLSLSLSVDFYVKQTHKNITRNNTHMTTGKPT